MSHEETVALFLAACRQQLEIILAGCNDPEVIGELTRQLHQSAQELRDAVAASSSNPVTAGAKA